MRTIIIDDKIPSTRKIVVMTWLKKIEFSHNFYKEHFDITIFKET